MSDDTSLKLRLSLFSQSTFPAPVSASLLVTSPALDLTATVSDGNTLAIRRAVGELVSNTIDKKRLVRALCWKADGQFLAVAWNDGTVGLLSVENTKVVHRITVAQRAHAVAGVPPAPVTHMAWARNLTGKRHFGRDAEAAFKGLVDLLEFESLSLDDARGPNDLVDLPHALTFLEIDTSLPKISPLPVSGGTGDDMFVFSTTASLESIFAPMKPEDNDVVDVMVAGMSDGTVHLSIYDSFSIGIFDVPVKLGPTPKSSQEILIGGDLAMCLHASHPEVSTHALLMRGGQDKVKTLYIVPMDLRFVSHSPVNLSLLASKTTTLQKLLRYIKQTQIHVANEWQSTRELPAKFLRFVQEDLGKMESGPDNIVQALYHTVLTGHVYQPVREWMVESIGDRGHKRWDKAVIPGLEAVRNLIHENMLPALERSTLILSRLSGIARFHEQDDHIGFTNTDIMRLVEILAALTLICHRILIIVIEELDLFRMFSSWLRITIDRVSTSSLSDEIMEKEALLDPGKILRYIDNYLVQSPMSTYFEAVSEDVVEMEFNAYMDDSAGILNHVDEQAKAQEAGEAEAKALPHMGFLVDLLTEKAGDVFYEIAEAEKRSVRFGQAAELKLPHALARVDMTMCSLHRPKGVDGIIYTAVIFDERPHTVGIFETKVEIINGISSAPTTTYDSVDVDIGDGLFGDSPSARVIDLKFLDDKLLLLLCQAEGKPPHLVCTPFRRTGVEGSGGPVQDLAFPEDLSAFAPVQMEVLGANDTRGGVPPRVSLLGKDRLGCKVFALRGVKMTSL